MKENKNNLNVYKDNINKETTKNKGGRPRKEINKELFEDLCKILCTESEILNILKTTDKTLNGWCKRTYGESFTEIYKKLSADGKCSIRRAQMKLAKTSAAMAIFLGKNYLGQKDVSEGTNTPDNKLEINLQIKDLRKNKDGS